MEREFLWLRAAGSDVFGTVLFTGYYEPLLEGSLERTGPYQYPIYGRPPDLLEIDLGAFKESLRGKRIIGRLVGHRVVPYFSRAQIDGQGALNGRGLELLWLRDPVDLFFLHIQGSGQILLPNGRRIHVNYAGTNGRPYRSIGRILIDQGAIPREQMSMQAIKAYLKAHPEEMEEILFANPSYVFFRIVKEGPLGSLGVPVTPGRTIATDPRLFPRGGLAFIRARKPVTDGEGRILRWDRFSRFVLNQDSGGAIRGAGRVDLFCGSGPEAELTAGHLQHQGRLYFLLWKGSPTLMAKN
jgi:membrane-bound lytic murein transglycosylase A